VVRALVAHLPGDGGQKKHFAHPTKNLNLMALRALPWALIKCPSGLSIYLSA